jgi:hypothetical protein
MSKVVFYRAHEADAAEQPHRAEQVILDCDRPTAQLLGATFGTVSKELLTHASCHLPCSQ